MPQSLSIDQGCRLLRLATATSTGSTITSATADNGTSTSTTARAGGKAIPAAAKYIHSQRTPVNGWPTPLRGKSNFPTRAPDFVTIVEHEVARTKTTSEIKRRKTRRTWESQSIDVRSLAVGKATIRPT